MNVRQLNRILLQTSLLPVIALLVISGVLVWQILVAEKTVSRMQLADQNIATISLISAYLTDEESGLHGFQTTANDIFLQAYDRARKPLTENLADLRVAIRNQGADEGPIDDLLAEHRRWLSSIAEPLIMAVHAGADTRGTGLNLRGKAQMEGMRTTLHRLMTDQRSRRMAEAERWQALVHHTLEAVIGLAAILGLLLGTYTRSRFHLILGAFETAIADLRRNSRATEASENRLRTTLSSIGDGVVVCDARGCVELLNPVAEILTGWRQADALHQPVDGVVQLLKESTREPSALPLPSFKEGEQSAPLLASTLLLRPDGTTLNVDARGSGIVDRHGEDAGSVTVIRDVTEQRRTQSALLVSEKQATAGRVAATIAHEIHNPLDAVMNLLFLLQNGASRAEEAQYLALARSELDRVTQISRAMLGMYRESRQPIPLDLRELLESVVLLLNHQMLHASVAIHAGFQGDLTLTGFPVELRQVFANLLGNATEASPRGGTIVLDVCEVDGVPEEPGVQIRVRDEGDGIEASAAPHLFEPFFTTKGEKGTGLGLWVSQGIVQKHGGTISFESSTSVDDHGTTFTVFLPRRGPQPEPEAANRDAPATAFSAVQS